MSWADYGISTVHKSPSSGDRFISPPINRPHTIHSYQALFLTNPIQSHVRVPHTLIGASQATPHATNHFVISNMKPNRHFDSICSRALDPLPRSLRTLVGKGNTEPFIYSTAGNTDAELIKNLVKSKHKSSTHSCFSMVLIHIFKKHWVILPVKWIKQTEYFSFASCSEKR